VNNKQQVFSIFPIVIFLGFSVPSGYAEQQCGILSYNAETYSSSDTLDLQNYEHRIIGYHTSIDEINARTTLEEDKILIAFGKDSHREELESMNSMIKDPEKYGNIGSLEMILYFLSHPEESKDEFYANPAQWENYWNKAVKSEGLKVKISDIKELADKMLSSNIEFLYGDKKCAPETSIIDDIFNIIKEHPAETIISSAIAATPVILKSLLVKKTIIESPEGVIKITEYRSLWR